VTQPGEVDPYATVRAAGIEVEVVPEVTIQPDPTPEVPNPQPIVVPEAVRFRPNLAALPDVLKTPDGTGFDLTTAVAMLWQVFHSLEIRTVAGYVTLTSVPGGIGGTVWPAGQTLELPIIWDMSPPQVPTGAVVTTEAGVAWMGKTTARVKPGSITQAGCVVQASVVGVASVTPNGGQPITYTATALYLHTPTIGQG
jgi:hypothetical protein